MVKIVLGVSYCGTGFKGWEMQRGQRTVQQALEQAVSGIADHPVRVYCAGRTDTGVHATGQVVHFTSTAHRPDRAWVLGVNTLLPQDVAVQWMQSVDESFHARFSAVRRHYRYLLLNRRTRCALRPDRVALESRPLSLQAMQSAATTLLGTHDFSSFRAAGCQARCPQRTVYSLQVRQCDGDVFVFDIVANAFLQRMVRNIVGTLLWVGTGRQPPGWVEAILKMRRREAAAATAPAAGVYLVEVCYPAHYAIPRSQPFPLMPG